MREESKGKKKKKKENPVEYLSTSSSKLNRPEIHQAPPRSWKLRPETRKSAHATLMFPNCIESSTAIVSAHRRQRGSPARVTRENHLTSPPTNLSWFKVLRSTLGGKPQTEPRRAPAEKFQAVSKIKESEKFQGNTIKCADEELVKFEAISKLEAELEAELERLELSMKGSILQENFIQELDQDVSAELVPGELNADIFEGKLSLPTPDRGSTPESVKFGVSPHELSSRLHEVIQSRLQDRIMELEVELAKIQKRIQHLESEKNSNLGSPMAHPIVMNLSGDTLDGYNEVFSDLNKLNGFQDREDPCIQGDNLKQDVIPVSQARDDGSLDSRDDDDDDDNDEDLLLIKQIVEKAKQGSPAILRAQRSLIWTNFDKN